MSDKIALRLGRRRFLNFVGAALMLSVTPVGLAAGRNPTLLAVRVWPADEYTRVTLELDANVRFSHFTLDNPDRLVVDIEGIEFNKALENLSDKVVANDPYIKLLRAGRYKPDVVRLVMELKTRIAPQVFTLQPVGEYGHRLVLDVYPETPVDPLLALLQQQSHSDYPLASEEIRIDEPKTAASATLDKTTDKAASDTHKPAEKTPATPASKSAGKVNRLITITLDPGHGGEDPGAVGRGGNR